MHLEIQLFHSILFAHTKYFEKILFADNFLQFKWEGNEYIFCLRTTTLDEII